MFQARLAPGGLGVAVPLLWEFPPVGVIGNRIRSRQGMHAESLSAGEVFPSIPVGWHTQD